MPSAPSHPFLPEPSRDVLSCPTNSLFLLPLPVNCIYADEAREMQHDERIQHCVQGLGFTGCGKTLPSCHSERSEESRSECFQDNARFLVACGSSE
jgi:hypothetical protein